MTNKSIFLSQLQAQAKKQAVLNKQSLLPKQLEGLAALIAKYPWQIILFLAIFSAILYEF